ncbi:MAG TPA: HEAT repeat domain-containing protein [Candidatus Sulfotelmatobacter sp.]|nr:HEAT repeat domain-containing protein [Candidatus Sulfotelmatobacter sp.]
MEFSSTFGATQAGQPVPAEADPRLQPTPGYGTLGPGSDIVTGPAQKRRRTPNARVVQLFAVAMGILVAIVTSRRPAIPAPATSRSEHTERVSAAAAGVALETLKPQKQAEALLEQAVAHSDGAVDQISSHVGRWQGKLNWDSQIATLTTAALNSSDMRVRESGIEVELAAYGLAKNPASLAYVVKTAESPDHSQKIWALWALGLMGNRGVGTEQVVNVLSAHLKDEDVDSRHWAVEGLALTGGSQTIPILLGAMHDDPSPVVREEAACGIAQSGMYTREERLSAVPQLLNYTDDSTLDAQTHGWAFQALSDITGERLGQDASAWREWFRGQGSAAREQ